MWRGCSRVEAAVWVFLFCTWGRGENCLRKVGPQTGTSRGSGRNVWGNKVCCCCWQWTHRLGPTSALASLCHSPLNISETARGAPWLRGSRNDIKGTNKSGCVVVCLKIRFNFTGCKTIGASVSSCLKMMTETFVFNLENCVVKTIGYLSLRSLAWIKYYTWPIVERL